MKFRFFSAVSITAAAACAVFACSSNKDSGGTSGACQAYANAYVGYAERCTGDIDPSQQAAVTSRYAQLCTGILSLPGVPDVSGQLNTCTASLGNAPCNVSINQLDGCDIQATGSLADNASCEVGEQCKSGDCKFDTSSADSDGGIPTCGTCAPAIADGADCTNGGTCVSGDVCKFSTQSDGGFSAVCTKKPSPGDVGATCTGAQDCKSPNHCTFGTDETGTCAAPVASGGACDTNSDCAANLVCGGQSTRTCQTPVTEGGDCFSDECAAGLACDTSTNKCTKIQFGAAGAACDGIALRCSRGECKFTTTTGGGGSGNATGVCPTIIADGQSCDRSSTTSACDEFASCVNGTCLLVPNTCK